MKSLKNRMEELIFEEKTENLIAIGAATASNCIPSFEHLYEKQCIYFNGRAMKTSLTAEEDSELRAALEKT